ncbi:MYXO-CTERM domain-containing protein [Streptomyces sp. HB372]|nr:MYXO-CTERM domain-containing protein [Streptomyces sp. HB372]
MRSPARLVTGTVGAAFTVIAFGLTAAAPSAYAGEFGRLEITPSTAAPGATVTVNTTACGKKGSGIGDANSLDAGDFEVRPGTHKEVVVGKFTVPHDTRPGTYEIIVSCDNGKDAVGDLEVIGGGKHEKPLHDRPSGHVRTGVGGSVEPNSTQVALGVGVIGLAAVGGLWLLRRRSEGAEGS